MEAAAAGCIFCEGRWPHQEALYEDDFWSLRALDGPPGWAVLWLRRHAEDITELTAEELASIGPVLARVCGGIRDAAEVDRVYINVFGETNRHLHIVLVARGEEIPPEYRGPAMLANMGELPTDDARAAEVARTLQRSLRESG